MSTAGKQMIGEALDNLTEKIFDQYFTSKEQDLAQKQALVASLFQNQMNLENEYRSQLIDAGVSLPEEMRSNNYVDIVNRAGNAPLLDTLNELYAESSMNLDALSNAKASFTKGRQIAEQYAAGADVDGDGVIDVGAYTPGETGVESFKYSPQEQEKLFASFEQLGLDPNLATSPGFTEGFQTFSDTDNALNRANAGAKLKSAQLQIADQRLGLASKEINVATMDLGPSIISQLTGNSTFFAKLPVIKNNIGGDKEQVDVAMAEWNTLMQNIQNNFPDIAPRLNSAIANYVERNTIDGITGPYDGFVSVLGEAYEDLNRYLALDIGEDDVGPNGEWLGADAYEDLHNRVYQYINSGVLARDSEGMFDVNLLELARGIDAAKDNIISSMSVLNETTAEGLLAEGFGYNAINDSLEFIDREGERFTDFNNEANPVYEAWLASQLVDPVEEDISAVEEAGGIDIRGAYEDLSEADITDPEDLAAKLETVKISKEKVQKAKNAYQGTFSSLGEYTAYANPRGWGNPNRAGARRNATNGLPGMHYQMDEVEIGNLKYHKLDKEILKWLSPHTEEGIWPFNSKQGMIGVAENRDWVVNEINLLNSHIKNLNVLRATNGLPTLGELDAEEIIFLYSKLGKGEFEYKGETLNLKTRHGLISYITPNYEKGFYGVIKNDGSSFWEKNIMNNAAVHPRNSYKVVDGKKIYFDSPSLSGFDLNSGSSMDYAGNNMINVNYQDRFPSE